MAPSDEGGKLFPPTSEGVKAAARELGVAPVEVRNARAIANLTPEAKQAAHDAGLDDNQSALLKIASYADEDQVSAVAEIVKAKKEAKASDKRKPIPPSDRPPETCPLWADWRCGRGTPWRSRPPPNMWKSHRHSSVTVR
jgi:hypothetical protein